VGGEVAEKGGEVAEKGGEVVAFHLRSDYSSLL
jgi:hypothetical protein